MRLIDADTLLNKLDSICVEKMNSAHPCYICTLCPLSDMVDVIDDAPTVDAVPVVRCKDCKHNSLSRRSGNAWCELGIELFQLYDFCSKGERRDEDEVD